uniref:Uncharacterized protein n=1 Tax=Panstrongylus lignarius TaxID=156445 RepID=A0A224Y6C9_9HEMI
MNKSHCRVRFFNCIILLIFLIVSDFIDDVSFFFCRDVRYTTRWISMREKWNSRQRGTSSNHGQHYRRWIHS